MRYRAEAASLEGFVQQLASNILPHGYWFYVLGRVPAGKDPCVVDEKLIQKYGIQLSRQQRARRKLAGQANLHYLRIGTLWVLLATKGEHRFFAEEAVAIRDVRSTPVQVGGYSLTVRLGNFLRRRSTESAATPDSKRRVRVQIGRERYRDLKCYFLDLATRRSVEDLAREFYYIPFEPYAPIRKQLLNLLRLVNAKRQEAGLLKVPPTVLRYRRRIVRPFGIELAHSSKPAIKSCVGS